MDIEQLKLVLETVKSTTGDAKQIGLVWLAVEGLSNIVGPLCGLTVAFLAARTGLSIARMYKSDDNDHAFAIGMRAKLMPDRSYGRVSEYERKFMLNKVAAALTEKSG